MQDWLRERRRQQSETYVPLVHRAGDEVQVDFFDVTVEVDGERESRGKGIRLQELVPIPSGESLRAIGAKLLTRLDQVSRQRCDQQGRSIAERKRFGEKRIRYRHYLPELAQKPQAVRQVAAELLSELGEPYGALCRLLVDSHGPERPLGCSRACSAPSSITAKTWRRRQSKRHWPRTAVISWISAG
ncbi:hypothetical protein L6Q96_13690 [Candidatus Binatia bacterium]|nr:hypothetical protein [Candidatus Binatia bacterium]